MNIKTGLLGVTITSAVLLMASCSGSSDSNSSGTSGSSSTSAGSAGKGTGGSSSSAGTSSNNGGSSKGGTSNDAGAPSNGGTANNGGFNFGGNFGFGGGGFDPEDFMCNPRPQVGSACMPGAQPCADGTTICLCQNAKWACIDLAGGEGGAGPGGGFGQLECPADKPMSGETCDGLGVCPYGDTGCGCFGGTWTCN